MKKEKKSITGFDPNAIGLVNNEIFGLPLDAKSAKIVIVHVPWDITVSFGAGTADNYDVIWDASLQVDLYDELDPDVWKDGIASIQLPLMSANQKLRKQAKKYIDFLSKGGIISHNNIMKTILHDINKEGKKINELIKNKVLQLHKDKKIVALLGGDHSTSLGIIQAQAQIHKDGFGILHLDAHADLRDAYEGFTYSHASVMFNAIQIPQVTKLVQVGIRDYCEAELDLISHNKKVKFFGYSDMQKQEMKGKTWSRICDQIIKNLPNKVHISFDIDALDPALCLHTGTPVPGGMTYYQAIYLLEKLAKSGKKIIGFDLVEVGNDVRDANVGARLLYKLCACVHKTNR